MLNMHTTIKTAFEIIPFPIKHAKLTRTDDSIHRSNCPFCEEGTLLVRRNEQGQLLKEDRCILCCRAVIYTDIGEPQCTTVQPTQSPISQA